MKWQYNSDGGGGTTESGHKTETLPKHRYRLLFQLVGWAELAKLNALFFTIFCAYPLSTTLADALFSTSKSLMNSTVGLRSAQPNLRAIRMMPLIVFGDGLYRNKSLDAIILIY